MSSLRCGECGAALTGAPAYCPNCGARVTATAAAGASLRFEDDTSAGGGGALGGDGDDQLEVVRDDLELTLAPRYTVVRRLGQGGMGTVFLGREPALRRAVAIKVLAPEMASDPMARARFEREARSAAELSHPNAVGVYGVGETRGLQVPYIVMQFIDGDTLAAWIDAHPRPPERAARRLLGEVAAALAAAHARGLVHRDVKPSNVLVDAETGRAYVADFGLAAPGAPWRAGDGDRLTSTGQVVGTVTHMSPEQLGGEGPVGPPSDVYSFGVLAFELLTGELPFQAGSAIEWAAAHLRDVPPRLSTLRPDISPEVARLVDRCLAKDPAVRPTARDLEAALLPNIVTEVAWPPPGTARVRRRGRRFAGALLAAGAAALLSLGALALPPDAVRAQGAWWERFAEAERDSGTVVEVDRPPEAASSLAAERWLWLGALGAGTAGFVILLPAAVAMGAAAAASALRARRAGWHRDTLAALSADPDGRSGLVLAGGREMATLSANARAGVLRARRLQFLAYAAAGAWAAGAAATWAVLAGAGVVGPVAGAGPVASRTALVVAAAPALLFVGVALAAAARERALLRPLPWRTPYRDPVRGGGARDAEADGREVEAWYAALPPDAHGVAGAPSGGRSAGRPLLLTAAAAAAAVLALWAAASLGTLAAGAALAADAVRRLGRPTAELVAALEQLHAEPSPAGDAWRAYLPTPDGSEDAAAALARLGSEAEPYAVPPRQLLRGADGELIAAEALLRLAREGRLSAELQRSIPALDAHPRTLLFRVVARARPATAATLPLEALNEAASANALAAAGAVARGDREGAARRLGENAAVAELLLALPDKVADRAGGDMLKSLALLQSLALRPLAELEMGSGGSPARAAALREAAARAQLQAGVAMKVANAAAGLAADPRKLAPFAALLTDSLVIPGVRVAAFDALWSGACLNARELVGGVDSTRSRWLMATADSMRDVPDARSLAAAAVQARERTVREEAEGRASGGGLLSRVLPRRLRTLAARGRACAGAFDD